MIVNIKCKCPRIKGTKERICGWKSLKLQQGSVTQVELDQLKCVSPPTTTTSPPTTRTLAGFEPLSDIIHGSLELCSESDNGFGRGATDDKVVGGIPANIESWPFLVNLMFQRAEGSSGTQCAGTLIAENWVLTAGHCCLDKALVKATFAKGENQFVLSSSEFVIHPGKRNERSKNMIIRPKI